MSGPDAWGLSCLRAAGSIVHPSACFRHSASSTSALQPLHLTVLMKRGSVADTLVPLVLATVFSASFSCTCRVLALMPRSRVHPVTCCDHCAFGSEMAHPGHVGFCGSAGCAAPS